MSEGLAAQKYDRLCHRYDRSHARWLRHEGGEAQCAFEGAVAALLRSGVSMLDAACGTGAAIRRLIDDREGEVDLTLLDASRQMLATCADIPARRVHGRLEALPFAAGQFDLTTCAWGVEATDSPMESLAELVRVTRPGGHICIVFCAERPVRTIWGYGLRRTIAACGLGQFLDCDVVRRRLQWLGVAEVRALHCTGPAAAILARK